MSSPLDRYSVECLEQDCALRPCMSPGYDQGSFSQGRGYTSRRMAPVCMTRHLRGCPHPLPTPSAERVRCCSSPKYPNRRQKQGTCASCGAVRPGWVGRLLNALPVGSLVEPVGVDTLESWSYQDDDGG